MNDEIEVVIASDDEHERVFAEIYFNGRFVALVSQDGETPLFEAGIEFALQRLRA